MSRNSPTKIGRPTKYINSIPRSVMHYTKKCLKQSSFPTIEELASILEVSSKTIYAWEKEFPDFLHTMELLRDSQRDMLIKNGLNGRYSTSFAVFILKSMHGFSDSRALIENTQQNNIFNVSSEILADALTLMKKNNPEKTMVKTE